MACTLYLKPKNKKKPKLKKKKSITSHFMKTIILKKSYFDQ